MAKTYLVFAGKYIRVIICYMLRQLVGSVPAARSDCVVLFADELLHLARDFRNCDGN